MAPKSENNGPARSPDSPPPAHARGSITLFGFPTTEAELEVLPRSFPWRASRAFGYLGGAALLSPAVGVIPPHAPWVVAVLGIGGWLGVRKWRERFTLLSFRGPCPKCGGVLSIPSGTPLKATMSLPCEGCLHDSRLTTDLSALETQMGRIR